MARGPDQPDTQDVINLTEKKTSVHMSDVNDRTRYRSTTGQTGLRNLNDEVSLLFFSVSWQP